MPLMTLSVQHGQTFDEARTRLETAVHDITSRFGFLVHLHRSSYAMGSPVVYLGYETTSLYSTFDR